MNKIIVVALALVFSISIFSQAAQDKVYSITGVVVDGDGKPMPDVRVNAAYLGLRWAGKLSAISGSDGSFILGVPKPESYVLTYARQDSSSISTYNRFYYVSDDFRPEVVVEEDRPAPKVTLRFPQTFGSLKTVVQDAELKRRIPTAQIKLCRLKAPNYCYTPTSKDLSVAAPDTAFILQVSAEGYEDWDMPFPSGVPARTSKEVAINLVRTSPSRSKGTRLAAPEILSPADGTDLYMSKRITKVEWVPVVGAESYTLDIEFCDGMAPRSRGCVDPHPLQFPGWEPTSGIKTTSYEFNFIGAQPGRWRVWAVDSEGRPGSKSDWYTFFYHL